MATGELSIVGWLGKLWIFVPGNESVSAACLPVDDITAIIGHPNRVHSYVHCGGRDYEVNAEICALLELVA